MNSNTLYLPDIIGKGYRQYWSFKGRYRVCKGSRASKKSKTTALNFIYRIMKYSDSNLLVVRKTFNSLKDSCYSDLKWAIERFGVTNFWKCKTSPLEITYIPTGQKIIFRGLDDPFKLTSITVDKGYLCWLWIEEAYEIYDESHFDILQECIRGKIPSHLFKQITITFNPWNEKHWLKKRFFDIQPHSDLLAITTNYLCNEWLDESDKKMFQHMKKYNFRRYQVAGLGNWGILEGLVFENWEEKDFDLHHLKQNLQLKSIFGLDFGYTNDPTALFCGLVDLEQKIIYVFDELYQKGLTNSQIYHKILKMGYSKEVIIADSSEPKSIEQLRELGLTRIRSARKGKDSVINGIQKIQDYKIIIHPKCVNFLTEISNYTWRKDFSGKIINTPIDDFNHLIDSMRYAMEFLTLGSSFCFY